MTTTITEQNLIDIDTANYPAGVYIVRVQIGNQIMSEKLIVM